MRRSISSVSCPRSRGSFFMVQSLAPIDGHSTFAISGNTDHDTITGRPSSDKAPYFKAVAASSCAAKPRLLSPSQRSEPLDRYPQIVFWNGSVLPTIHELGGRLLIGSSYQTRSPASSEALHWSPENSSSYNFGS